MKIIEKEKVVEARTVLQCDHCNYHTNGNSEWDIGNMARHEKQCVCEHKNTEFVLETFAGEFIVSKECLDCEKNIGDREVEGLGQEMLEKIYNECKQND